MPCMDTKTEAKKAHRTLLMLADKVADELLLTRDEAMKLLRVYVETAR